MQDEKSFHRQSKLHIDFAYVISLKFRDDRRVNLTQELNKAKLGFRFFDALHGMKIDLSMIPDSMISHQSKCYLSKGSIGALLSHYYLWVKLLQTSNDFFLIFEDDVIIPTDFKKRISRVITTLPKDFDIFYLGSGCSRKSNTLYTISENIYRPYFPRKGMYAYVISRKGISIILQHLFPIRITCGSLDTIVGNLVRKNILTAYHSFPDICSVDKKSPSNIFNFSNKEKVLHHAEF